MKKIIIVLAIIAMFGFQGCEGPEGPPGFDGEDGEKAGVYQTSPVSFVSNNNYNELFSYVKN